MTYEEKIHAFRYACILTVIILTGLSVRINDDKNLSRTINFEVQTHCQSLADQGLGVDWDACTNYYTKLYEEKGTIR